MRFEFYHAGLDDIPKLSLDGTVSNSVHFSHWEGNETPAEVSRHLNGDRPQLDLLTQSQSADARD